MAHINLPEVTAFPFFTRVADPKHAKKLLMVMGLGFLAGFPPFSGAVKAFENRMLVLLGNF